MVDYRTYIKSEEWQRKRELVLEFWDHKCATCFNHRDLHVHHRTYERLGEEKLTDLIVLCEGCHEKFHETLHRGGGGEGPQPLHVVMDFFLGLDWQNRIHGEP